ncbi:MAG: DUF697 domain-containing protein [Pseudomonas sp.]|uniref:YcjF family protein n=1 Tax=Pseudomonas sp. TaxID=306 RepID=UPI0033986E63
MSSNQGAAQNTDVADDAVTADTATRPGPDTARQAEAIVGYYSKWGGGAGFIPVPFLDAAAIAGVQIKMLTELSRLYKVPFEENRGRMALVTLLGTIAPSSLTMGAMGAAIRSVPLVGSLLSVVTLPAFAAASTFAVGSVFSQHLASGGTLLDINVEQMKDEVSKEFSARKTKTA